MKRIAMLLAVLTLAAGTMFAQNGAFAPYVNGSVSTTSNLGFHNPDYTAGLGLESSTKHLLLDIHGTFDSANSTKTDNGYALGLQGSGYFKLFGHLLAGGGANWNVFSGDARRLRTVNGQNVTQFLNAARNSAHPFIGGGLQVGKVRVIANYNLPGSDALTKERKVDFNTEIFIAKHLRLTQETSVNSYVNGSTVRVSGTQLGAGLKFVL